MEAKQGYTSGIDQDSAVNKRNPASYFSGRNFRVNTQAGLATGSIEVEDGQTITFQLPNVPEMTLTSGEIIPAQSNLRIIGGTTMVDTIIIFSTNDTTAIPDSYGQIWKLQYDETTNTIIGLLPNNELDLSVHLVYNQKLNFSTEYRIKAVARYETSSIQRVYWTDYYNPVKVFNLAISNPLDFAVENTFLRPSATFSQPIIDSVGTGNLRTGCVAQVTYRLLDTSGAESLVAPISVLTPLPGVSLELTAYEDFQGNGGASIKNKSITYTIQDIDTDYNVIEHFIVISDETGSQTIYKFREDVIPESGELTVTCDDIDLATIIPLTEFNLLSSGFDVAKDIEIHGNRLVAANTKTSNFEVDFDARAYRFNTTPESELQGTPNITLVGGIAPLYDSVPLEHDAINPYNQEQTGNWFTPARQFKYQKDGATLGGSGKYVSYKFTTELLPSYHNYSSITTMPPHLDIGNHNASSLPLDLGVTNIDGSPRLTPKAGQLRNYASAWAHGNLAGYNRGETYRFGIAFYNRAGSVSFVNWIGDVRFPDVEDGYPLQVFVGAAPYLSILGIEFTVDTSALGSDITGYAIVRVKREDRDCTKLGSGMLMYFDIQTDTSSHSLLHRWEDTGPNNMISDPANPFKLIDDTNINSVIKENNYHLSDKPGFNLPQIGSPTSKRLCYLLSPLGQLDNFTHKVEDYIATRGYYESKVSRYGGTNDGATPAGDRDYGFYYKVQGYLANPHNRERFEVTKLVTAQVGEYFLSSNDFLSGTGANNLMNASYSRNKIAGVETANTNVPLGMGGKKILMQIAGGAFSTLIHNTGDPGIGAGNSGNMRWYGSGIWTGPDAGGTTIAFNSTNTSTTSLYFKEVVYARYLLGQYGGNTYGQRSINKYMSTGHFQPLSTLGVQTFKVFGGDTFVTYYDDEQIHQYWGNVNFLDTYKDASTNKLGVAICYPAESRVNTNFRTGNHWAANREGTNMGAYESSTWSLANVWTTENTVETKFFAKDFLLNLTEEHPHQLWASENKIDGELIDNWRLFKIANSTEVDGVHGPINRIVSHKDSLVFYQNKAYGIASIDERVITQDGSGQELVLGTGGVFPTYTYISTNTGATHQFGVVPSDNGIYHYDSRLNKIFLFNGSNQNLSDAKGIASLLKREISGEITNLDKTLRINEATGVHATVDQKQNRILFTFLNNKPAISFDDYIAANGYNFPDNTYVEQDGITYYIPNSWSPTIIPVLGLKLSAYKDIAFPYKQSFTLAYNEVTQAFEFLYDYVPGLYLEYGRRLLSSSPLTGSSLYEHNNGVKASYYGRPPVKSTLSTILAHGGDITKIFNNLEYQSQLFDTNGVDIYNETLSRILIENEYQTTGVKELVVNDNIKRRMRTWRYIIPRDTTNTLARIRNPWVKLTLEYDNNNDKRLILHELLYSVTPSSM